MPARGRRALVALALVATGCVARGADDSAAENERLSAPTFAPIEDANTTITGAGSTTAPGADATGGTSNTSNSPSGTPGAAGGVAVLQASVTDPTGDLTPSVLDPPPSWADLAGATLHRRADGYELAITLGGAAPEHAPDTDHTMNIASFFDLDGDGSIDVEVWANVAAGGWGGAVYDASGGHFGDDSGVAITIEEGKVVLRFPLSRLSGSDRFRWALASEWGRYETIGTDLAARDDAPDGDQPAPFPA